MSEKTFFGCIDARNAKFQGYIKDRLPNGIGILLNQQFQLIIASWNNDQPHGPSLLVFSNRDYLYGTIKNKKLDGLCVFVKASGAIYYMNVEEGVANKIAFVQASGLVTELAVVDGKLKTGEIVAQKVKETNKWDMISKILGGLVPKDKRSVKSFLKDSLEKENYGTIECSQSSGLTFVGFRDMVSLGAKFDRDDKVKQIGNFQLFPRSLDYGRKYTSGHLNSTKTEEGKFSDPQNIVTYESSRPLEASRQTEDFFKRGTNFTNVFFKAAVVDDISAYLSNIEKQRNHNSILQYGQKILEEPQDEQGEHYYQNQQYTIEQVKKDIYAALERKNKGRKADIYSPPVDKSQNQPSPYDRIQQIDKKEPSYSKSPAKRYIYTSGVKRDARDRTPPSDPIKLHQFSLNQTPLPIKPSLQYVVPPLEPISLPGQHLGYPYHPIGVDQQLLVRLKQQQQALLRLKQIQLMQQQMSKSPSRPAYKMIHYPKSYLPQAIDRSAQKFSISEDYQKNRQEIENPSKYRRREDPQYPNYTKYKNRNRTPSKRNPPALQENNNQDRSSGYKNAYFPKKYQIYQRKTTEPKKVSEFQEQPRFSASLQQQEVSSRYRKTFKYL